MEKNYISFVICCIAAAFIACGSETGGNASIGQGSVSSGHALDFDRATFECERQLWLEQNIQDYSFQQVFRSPPAMRFSRVYVTNQIAIFSQDNNPGVYDSTYYYPDDTSNSLFSLWRLIISISDLYAEIEQYANNDDTLQLDVTYDSILHYPKYVSISIRVEVEGRPYTTYRYVTISSFLF